jgi:hypothetical protein
MKTQRISRISSLLALMAISTQLGAQDLEYKTVTKLDMGGGALNFVVKLAGSSEKIETAYLKGSRLRTDEGNSSTIIDFEKHRLITLDHKAKTFSAVGFDQMAAMAQAMAAQAQAEVQAARSKGIASASNDSVRVDFKYDLQVEPTGERERIADQDAQRYVLTLRTDMTFTPEGGQSAEAGTLVLLVDSWNSTDGVLAGAYRRLAEREYAEYRKTFAKQEMGSLFMQDPKLRAAAEKAAAEAEKMGGFPVRQTTYLVVVPPGVEFDAKALLAANAAGSGNTTGNVTRNVVRGALGGALGRALGGQSKQEEKKADEKPRPLTLLKVVSEVRDLKAKTLPESLFEIPAGYKELQLKLPGNT